MGGGLPIPFLESPGPRPPRGRGLGLGGRAKGTHRRSRRCAAAATCRTPGSCRAERGRAGSAAGTVGPPAGAGTATRRAQGPARRRTSSRPVRKRRQERRPVGLAGSGAGGPASGSSPGRGRSVHTQPPPRASSASRLLPPPAFRAKSFRGHAESTASSARLRPPATSQIWRLLVHQAHWSPRLNFRTSLGLAVFPGGPFTNSPEHFRGEVTSLVPSSVDSRPGTGGGSWDGEQ